MIALDAVISQQFAPAELPAAVRAALGKPLRRAPVLAQLAVLGALACLPGERRQRPTALLWQSTSGPRLETLELLGEVCQGSGEPMPFTFLATVPASAAVHLRPFIPGLRSAATLPLDSEQLAHWGLLLNLADAWLSEGRYEQVLCAQLDHWPETLSGHWLALSATPSSDTLATVRPGAAKAAGQVVERITEQVTDVPDLPLALARWLADPTAPALQLESPAAAGLTVEFARP